MIGLVDFDLQTSTSKTELIPNLEIMKLAIYYRTEENHFCRLIGLEEEDLSSYDKVFFFSEGQRPPEVPPAFLRANNVIFGGTAFTKGVYIPFENELIEYMLPRPSIYKEFLKTKFAEGVSNKVIERVLDDSYYRNYIGDKKLPMPSITPRKRMILYDQEFFYPDWEQTIQKITDRRCKTIIRVHPIVCKNLTDFFKARSYQYINRNNEYILDLNIEYDDIPYMINHYKNKFLADVVKASNICINMGGTFPTKLKYANDIVYTLNLLFSFWAAGIFIKIKYNEPAIGTTNPFEELSQFISKWSDLSRMVVLKPIKDKIPKDKKYNIIREQMQEVIKMVPASKCLFEQSYPGLVEKGVWRI